MEFGLNESQEILKESARKFFAGECPITVVRRIMEDHAALGAKLAVERSVHGGASFRVTLSRDVAGLRRSLAPATS